MNLLAPISTSSPGESHAVLAGLPLIFEPLLLPRSLNWQRPSTICSSACRLDAASSATGISTPAPRPITIGASPSCTRLPSLGPVRNLISAMVVGVSSAIG
jgi:hypothetical protein